MKRAFLSVYQQIVWLALRVTTFVYSSNTAQQHKQKSGARTYNVSASISPCVGRLIQEVHAHFDMTRTHTGYYHGTMTALPRQSAAKSDFNIPESTERLAC